MLSKENINVRVIFIKSHVRRRLRWVVGNCADMDTWLAEELIEKGIVKKYDGAWPPKVKTKINLKDLNNG